MKVPLCFSAASIKIVNTNCAVKNISMNSPCTTVVPPPSDVCTFNRPGNIHCTSPLAARPPRIWAINNNQPLTHGNAPIRHIPNVTAGLNRPPLMRKKTQALTASENPKPRYIYCSCCGFEPVCSTVKPAEEGMLFATCAPERANQKKRAVPTNSPHIATKWLRCQSGILFKSGRRRSASSRWASGLAALVNGMARPRPWSGCWWCCQFTSWTGSFTSLSHWRADSRFYSR